MSQQPSRQSRTVIIGVGNELLRDEGVGVVVARGLRGERLPEGVTVIEGAVAGLDLIFEMQDADRAIIVDAADMGLSPGSIRILTPEQLEQERLERIASLHQIDLLDVLELGRMTDVDAEVIIVAIQPAEVAPGAGLSVEVGQVVGEVMAQVKSLL